MTIECPKCHHVNPPDTIYCGQCAAPLPPSDEPRISHTRTLETPAQELTRGTTFADRYEIIEEVGRGGMGSVYRVYDKKIEGEVALKLIKAEIAADTKTIKRFQTELKLAREISHRNVCRMYDLGEAEGTTFITMEYVPGEDLKSFIRRSGQLAVGTTVRIARQICEGLAEAHDLGVVHRDLKPSNIMIDKKGNARILDFGIARSLKAKGITGEGVMIGTPEYMSPEQAEAKEVDHRSDIYSLGVILYEMVTGRLPFEGETPLSIAMKHKGERPRDPRNLNPQISDDLNRLILRCMEKDKEDRYLSADDVLSELNNIASRLPSTEREIARRKPITSREITVSFNVKKLFVPIFIVLIAAIVGLILWHPWSPKNTVPYKERDWILITDFNNQTGEEVFDLSLNKALAVSIGQSSYINIFSQRMIRDALRRMKKNGVKSIDEAVGQEIALREGINIMVIPGISRVGNTYVLTCVIQDAASGEIFRSEIVHAQSQDDVLRAMDELAENIRQDLGESLSSISQKGKSLVKVTTRSLEALKQYSLGINNHRAGNFHEAKFYYEKALEIDPAFTSAEASLGMLQFERFDKEKGRRLLADAIKKIDELTDKEKYGILAFYARAVENDLQKATEHLKTLLALYPDYSAGHNNLAWFYSQMGRFEEAVAEYEEAIRVDPSFMLPYGGLSYIYLNRFGEIDKAVALCSQQLKYDDQNPLAYDCLGWAYLGKGEMEKAEEAFRKALESYPEYTLDLFRLAHTYRLQGRYQDAIEPLQKIIEIDPAEEPSALYDLGMVYELMGNEEEAKKHFERYLRAAEKWVEEYPNNPMSYFCLGLALTHLGQKAEGLAVGQKALMFDPTRHFEYAELLSAQGKTQEALDQLELAVEKGYRNFIWMKIDVNFHPLYEEPRFKELIRKHLKQ